MRTRMSAGLAILAALTLGSPAPAVEPDGRVAFRYEWIDATEHNQGATKLRVSVTAFVDLVEAQLDATLPAGIDLSVRASGHAPSRWPARGMPIGELKAGQTIVVDLDVAKPLQGRGIVEFVVQAMSGGLPVREGVGVPVGKPGTAPIERNGAAEFPAAREEPAP